MEINITVYFPYISCQSYKDLTGKEKLSFPETLPAGCKSFAFLLYMVIQKSTAYFENLIKTNAKRQKQISKIFKIYFFKFVHLVCPQNEHHGLHNKDRKGIPHLATLESINL